MSFSEQQRQRILAEAQQTLSRPLSCHSSQGRAEPEEQTRLDAAPPASEILTRNQRDRLELQEQEVQFAAERRRQQREWQRERERHVPTLSVADVELIVADAIAAERRAVLPLLADIVAELLDEVRERNAAALKERACGLELQIVRLEAAVAALEKALIMERTRTLDVPMRAVN
jgi:hypothetical protein